MDTLEQVELIDLGDQDGADVFLPCEDPPPTPQTSGMPLCFGPVGTGWSELDVKAGWGSLHGGAGVGSFTHEAAACPDFREADLGGSWVTDS